MELNAQAVREAHAEGERIVFGDATRKEVLHHIKLEHARILVLAISDPIASRHTVWLARQLNPDIHIIVRTRYMSEMSDLIQLGANEVIPEEFETSIEIFSRVLREYGIARQVIQRQVTAIRSEGYQMLRLPSLPILDMNEIAEALKSAATETLFVEPDAFAAGRTIGELGLRKKTGVTIIAITREGHTEINPGPETPIQVEDVLVLLGGAEQIDRAIEEIVGVREAGS